MESTIVFKKPTKRELKEMGSLGPHRQTYHQKQLRTSKLTTLIPQNSSFKALGTRGARFSTEP